MIHYGLTQTAPPSEEPLTLAEAKSHLRVDTADDDALIAALIAAARAEFEEQTFRQLVTATWQMRLDRFPPGQNALVIPRAPLQAISAITYTDTAGATQTLGAVNYAAEIDREPGLVRLAYGQSWPATRAQPNAVSVTFTAGYGAAAAVDELIKEALKLAIGAMYEFREDFLSGATIAKLPKGVDSIVTLFNIGDLFTEYGYSET